MTERRVPRLPIILLIVAVIAAAGLIDRRSTASSPAAVIDAVPVAAPRGALSSSWFCAGAASQPARTSDGQLVIVNASDRSVHGSVTLIAGQGAQPSRSVDVGPMDQLTVPETLPAPAPYVGAIVDLDGGQAAVQQVVSGTQGSSSSPCATTGAGSWYFASGTTQENATLSLTLLNPFPEDAIADLSFTTEQGSEMPADFQGIVVPARGLFGVDLGSHLRRRASIAATVKVRVGRVAAFETQVVTAQAPGTQASGPSPPWPPGVSLVLGAASVGRSWWWPNGMAADGMTEKYVIYNPGAVAARVSLAVDLDQGSADPFQISVDPRSVTEVVTNAESRVPKAIGHAARLTSLNAPGVVAERVLQAVNPSPQTGIAREPGARMLAGSWLSGPGTGTGATSVSVYNPGASPVTVTIATLAAGAETPLGGRSGTRIPAHHRVVASVNGAGEVVVVHAGGAVAVEREIDLARPGGLDVSIAVPLSP